MEIILSINNREKVIHLPVLPSEVMIQSPEQNETYQTIGLGEVNLIGNKGLKSLSFSSFFPEKAVSYSKSNEMFGWEYVNELENLRDRKLPFRLVITETPINMPVTIDTFEYGLRAGTNYIQYSLELKEFRFM
ncbi:hypothetical protein [Clostridium aminobutyricum]|uniref:Uncharacterized protein n=1 Tax=Clostridium aminobutyricum TaxID=33953 RepID=A0A939D8N1_CLOAM|nr:hypothetical protein [Clostridium aminobutyricum]MBN7773166.1 hypothetical protein [Clostridium aminobutyricum]